MNREIEHLMSLPLSKLEEIDDALYNKWKRVRAVILLKKEDEPDDVVYSQGDEEE